MLHCGVAFAFPRIGAILACGAIALSYEAWHLGMTADEPSHLAASYAWWNGQDVLRPSDTPPLMRILCGWIPKVMSIPLQADPEAWKRRDAYGVGARIISGIDAARARRLLFFMRLPFIAFPLLIAFLLWHWGRELFGEPVGLALAACALLEPTIMGHGALIKSDVPAAFGALWFAYAAWRYWLRPDLRRLLLMTAAMVGATLIKFTLLPLLPVTLLLALWRGPRLAGALLVPTAFYLATLAAGQFHAAPVPPEEIGMFRPAGVPKALMPVALQVAKLPWPAQWVHGLMFVLGAARGESFTGYMLGHKISGWVPAYYPLAWALKYPIALQLLTLAGLGALAARLRQKKARAADAFIWGSAAFYLGTAVLSHYHIGFRHLLPALPFLILGGGFALERWGRLRPFRIAAAIGLVWLAAASVHIYPQGISYFNEWTGGPVNGWKYLADSNLDWGQNLPELGKIIERRRLPSVRCFIFGLDAPERYIPGDRFVPQPWPYAPGVVTERRLTPAPGFYAVSVNPLVGVGTAPGYEDYLACFRPMKPIDRAGYSILVYEVQ